MLGRRSISADGDLELLQEDDHRGIIRAAFPASSSRVGCCCCCCCFLFSRPRLSSLIVVAWNGPSFDPTSPEKTRSGRTATTPECGFPSCLPISEQPPTQVLLVLCSLFRHNFQLNGGAVFVGVVFYSRHDKHEHPPPTVRPTQSPLALSVSLRLSPPACRILSLAPPIFEHLRLLLRWTRKFSQLVCGM